MGEPAAAGQELDPVGTAAERGAGGLELFVWTLGGFRVERRDGPVEPSEWARDKAVQLFQYLVTVRRRRETREQIVETLWPELDPETAERDFKVALNAVQRALEPEREARSEPRFVRRFGPAYGLELPLVWVDAEALERGVAEGNQLLRDDPRAAADSFRDAVSLYSGDYLPERRYEDWTSAEREHLQVIAFSTMTTLGELELSGNPLESVRLAQTVLRQDPLWEDAWRLLMRAHLERGNRAQALRAWQRCAAVLEAELGLEPLPETKAIVADLVG